ncbi:G-alpha-domain-containing protein [Pilatotrama ljubarskyi]|nr:G-alpha-domain-containing protein [Pilatotrama ljubarskyi]
MQASRYATDPDDPLAAALAPPPNETAAEREERVRREEEAKRISDEIDERLKAERAAWKRHKAAFKLLLLGQSESGKSTTLKNFQLAFAPNAWRAERASWRAVIHLNLVRSVNHILDVLSQEMAKPPSATSPATSPFIRPSTAQGRFDQQASAAAFASSKSDASDPASPSGGGTPPEPPFQFTNTHALLKLRLVPLRRVEADLKQLIGAATDEHAPDVSVAPPGAVDDANAAVLWDGSPARRRPDEFYVRANHSWRDALRGACHGSHGEGAEHKAAGADGQATLDDATEIIASCADDMRTLWDDPVVREVLKRRKIRMEQSPGFFLDDIMRIAERTYEPTDDDVVRARLRTLGVQEHRLVMERSGASSLATNDVAREWMIYDVGGSRTSRAAWFPYFDDANAILFLAPISCFDELLQEDRRVNRLEDSFLLWRAIVQSKLLAKCILVLFLNKYDLLDKKLRSGISVKRYLPSFGDRENSAPVLAQYLYQKFKDQHREYSPQPRRPFYGYVTTAIVRPSGLSYIASGLTTSAMENTKATTSTLAAVRDGILRHNLQKADFV